MKVRITESYPGELDRPRGEVLDKVLLAGEAAVGAVLRKGARGGELAIVEELGDLMAARYHERMVALREAANDAIRSR